MKNTELNTSELEVKQQQPAQEQAMRILTENEVLNVAGGPEIEVGTGTD